MPPNSIIVPVGPEPSNFPVEKSVEAGDPSPIPSPQGKEEANFKVVIFQFTANLLAHILIGFIVGASLIFAFRNGLPLGATPLHIVLCVTGYQLLMAQAILSLTNQNGWSSKLKLVDKKRAHWILQILGSGLAIAGSVIKMLDKATNFNTLHGQFGLVAMVFTSVSLVNGCASLWAFELRRFIPANLSKITHICFGTVAFVAACVCLCYGYDKNLFRNWANTSFADAAIAAVVILLVIVIVNPIITFCTKSLNVVKSR